MTKVSNTMMNLLTEYYECPVCEANYKTMAVDMCEFCILKFFTDNPEAEALTSDGL